MRDHDDAGDEPPMRRPAAQGEPIRAPAAFAGSDTSAGDRSAHGSPDDVPLADGPPGDGLVGDSPPGDDLLGDGPPGDGPPGEEAEASTPRGGSLADVIRAIKDAGDALSAPADVGLLGEMDLFTGGGSGDPYRPWFMSGEPGTPWFAAGEDL